MVTSWSLGRSSPRHAATHRLRAYSEPTRIGDLLERSVNATTSRTATSSAVRYAPVCALSQPPKFAFRSARSGLLRVSALDRSQTGKMTDAGAGSTGSSNPWKSIAADATLAGPIRSVGAGNAPAGGDLSLDIGWVAFEQLVVEIARHVLGLNQFLYRRYGTAGQAQYGVDIAGRQPDETHAVLQCKHVHTFTAKSLRKAVDDFANGRRPFAAKRLVIATSHPCTGKTQVQNELAALQKKYGKDFDLDLWGPAEINAVLRERGDIVARFWTRETAATFSTGAPLPGVAAPAPQWTRIADQVLFGPLEVDGLDGAVVAADQLRQSDALAAAAAYGQIGDQLAAEGFSGHAQLMWQRQLDSLDAGGDHTGSAELTAQLAALALHEGDMHHAWMLQHKLRKLTETTDAADVTRHHELVDAAIHTALHPFGENERLLRHLRSAAENDAPEYLPVLVTVLAELDAADAISRPAGSEEVEQGRAADIVALIDAALQHVDAVTPAALRDDVRLRLRLAAAHRDADQRSQLLSDSRLQRLRRPHAAAALGAEARRNGLEGSVDVALEHWRQAVANALHEGLADDASHWLYAIRALNMRYGPITDQLEEEHRLAQALPTSAGGILRRARNPEHDARRHALNGKGPEAIRATRRWLADSIAIGSWVSEDAAVELLGDLYAGSEPERAALCYQWAGSNKKLVELARAVGDRRLPIKDDIARPWWCRTATLALIAAQEDLLEDATAQHELRAAVDLVIQGRAGELMEGPLGSPLTVQSTKTACVLAARSNSEDAQALLDLLAGDVARPPNTYRQHDDEHVGACLAIASHHPTIAYAALTRLLDLAEAGVDDALNALPTRFVRTMIGEQDPTIGAVLTDDQRRELLDRVRQLAAFGRYGACLALALLEVPDEAVLEKAAATRDQLLARPEPDGQQYSFGTRLTSDGTLLSLLDADDRHACLSKLLGIAEDRRETAQTRQDALGAAFNILIAHDDAGLKTPIHQRIRPFVEGTQDGSALDAETTNPHPLSTFKVNFGSASLRPHGLRLADATSVTDDDRSWVREQALVLLRSDERAAVRTAAVVLLQQHDVNGAGLEPGLLAAHREPIVRQLAAITACAQPDSYASVLRALASDPNGSVRDVLARELWRHARSDATTCGSNASDVTNEVLAKLADDIRHSVRRTAAGIDDG
jgi:hypothetical protein